VRPWAHWTIYYIAVTIIIAMAFLAIFY